MNGMIKKALVILMALMLISTAACAKKGEDKTDKEPTVSDPYSLAGNTEEEEENDPEEVILARQRAPMLGEWTATSTNDQTGEETRTTFTFHEDGNVTSVTEDGKNAFGGIFKKVRWSYDIATGNLMITYTDIRGSAIEYTFDVTIARENYIIIRSILPENEAGKKLSLTR